MSRTDIKVYDFTISRGRESVQTFRRRADGAPVNHSGMTLALVCSDPTLNMNAEVEFPKSGEFLFRFPAALTENLLSRNLPFEVLVYPEGILGFSKVLFEGKIRILQGLA